MAIQVETCVPEKHRGYFDVLHGYASVPEKHRAYFDVLVMLYD